MLSLFGQTSPFDDDVVQATNENNTAEKWDVIMNICDKVGSNKDAKDCLRSIIKRLQNADPHVAVQAITLLDACINNCGQNFHLEIASRDFETEFRKLLSKSKPEIQMKLKLSLKKWAENEFKTDAKLNLIPSLYTKLKEENHDFTDSSAPEKKHLMKVDSTAQKEDEDIAKAIALSLKENQGSPRSSTNLSSGGGTGYSSLYPSVSLSSGNNNSSSSSSPSAQRQQQHNQPQQQTEPRKVRALYDFEAAEDNELTFMAGEIIQVLEDTDPNWWKGYNQRGEGLFPSNFVTADLSVEPEPSLLLAMEEKSKKTVQFIDEIKKETEIEQIEINEERIDRLLHLLHDANPEDQSQDTEEMLQLESQVNQMLPLIDTELERVDRKHAQLTQLSSDLVAAINLYHTLMREPENNAMYGSMTAAGGYPGAGMRPGQMMMQQPTVTNGLYSLPPQSSGNIYGAPTHNMMTSMQSMPPHMQMMHQGFAGMSINSNQTLGHQMMQTPSSSQLTNGPQQLQAPVAPSSQQHIDNNQQQMMGGQQTSVANSVATSMSQTMISPQQLPPSNMMPNHQTTPSSLHLNQQQQQQQPPPQQSQQQQPSQLNHFGQIPQLPPQQNFPQQQSQPQQHMPQAMQHTQPLPQSHNMNMPLNSHPQQFSHHPHSHLHHPQQDPHHMPPFVGNQPHPQQHQQQQQQQQQLHQNPASIHMIAANHMAINQPVTSILPQTDSRTNIPVYQQQR